MSEKFKTSPKVIIVDKYGDSIAASISRAYSGGVIDMALEAEDFHIGKLGLPQDELPNFLMVIPEAAGVLIVELTGSEEGQLHTITAVQIDNNMGSPMQYKVRRVIKAGSTAKYSVVW